MKTAPLLLFAAVLLSGCAARPASLAVRGDYRMLAPEEGSEHVQIGIYGDRTMIWPTSMNLSFHDRNGNPIPVEELDGHHLFPVLADTFYMKNGDHYFSIQIDEKPRIYSMDGIRTE